VTNKDISATTNQSKGFVQFLHIVELKVLYVYI